MSIYAVYIGPVVRLGKLAYIEEDDEIVCVTEGCKYENEKLTSKFCPECGGPATLKTFEEEREATWNDFLYDNDFENERFVDVLTHREYHDSLLFPNHRANAGCYGIWTEFDDGPIPVTPTTFDIEKQKEEFRWKYKDLLEALDKWEFPYTIDYIAAAFWG